MTSRCPFCVVAIVLLLPMIFLLSGCIRDQNARLSFGNALVSPSFVNAPNSKKHALGGSHLFDAVQSPRLDWQPVRYLSPFDGVVQSHELRIYPRQKKNDPARNYGRFPTFQSALDPQSTSGLGNVLMTIDEFGRSFIGTPYAIAYLSITGDLYTPMQSPRIPWKRTKFQRWSSGYPISSIKIDPKDIVWIKPTKPIKKDTPDEQ